MKNYIGSVGLCNPESKIGKKLRKKFDFVSISHLTMERNSVVSFYQGVFEKSEIEKIKEIIESEGGNVRDELSWNSLEVANILN